MRITFIEFCQLWNSIRNNVTVHCIHNVIDNVNVGTTSSW